MLPESQNPQYEGDYAEKGEPQPRTSNSPKYATPVNGTSFAASGNNYASGASTAPPPPPPDAATAAAVAAPGVGLTAIAQSVTLLDWQSLNILLGFFAFIVMVASAQIFVDSWQISAYQVACGAASFGIAILSGLLAWCGKLENSTARVVISGFQFLWWVAGVIVLTFFGSYQTTARANGYFGAWFSFFFATLMLMSVSPAFEHRLNKAAHSPRKPALFLIVASAVVMGASISPCSPQEVCAGYAAWAVAMSSISLFLGLVLFLLADRLGPVFTKNLARFLVLWWAAGALVVTFGGPFQSTGNGYFFSYAAFVASISLLQTFSH
ncbi:hypothetical protein BASA81_008846 [Batrachochytrium salamandrivorans]|nr:hypothetical protein BASA81_008846 [Batrachochytrium salamandrivorans]